MSAFRREHHGLSQSSDPAIRSTYATWVAMRQRCFNPRAQEFPRYGGRGIGVAEAWTKFSAFLRDMGPRPTDLSLERIDNDRDYGPENCRWATVTEQARNQRKTVLSVEIVREARRRHAAGERISPLARSLGVHVATLDGALKGRTWADV